MAEFLIRTWQHLVGRIDGPMAFRLILQPMVATFLAIRAGSRDAREGRAAYAWALITDVGHRMEYLRDGSKDIAKVFIAAVVIDFVYEIIVFRRIYPTQSLIIATILALVPYVLIRGPVSRIMRQRYWS